MTVKHESIISVARVINCTLRYQMLPLLLPPHIHEDWSYQNCPQLYILYIKWVDTVEGHVPVYIEVSCNRSGVVMSSNITATVNTSPIHSYCQHTTATGVKNGKQQEQRWDECWKELYAILPLDALIIVCPSSHGSFIWQCRSLLHAIRVVGGKPPYGWMMPRKLHVRYFRAS